MFASQLKQYQEDLILILMNIIIFRVSQKKNLYSHKTNLKKLERTNMYTEVEEYLKAGKPFRVQVTPEQSKELQKLCFKYEIPWDDNEKIIQLTERNWLFIDNCIQAGYYDDILFYKKYYKIKLKEKDTVMQVNTTMTKEKITELLNAFGRDIEFEVKLEDNWSTLEKGINLREFMAYLRDYEVRTKVKHEYVPWETVEEVLPHMGKVIKRKDYHFYETIYFMGSTSDGLTIQGWTAKKFFETYKFADGTPCGKLKQ